MQKLDKKAIGERIRFLRQACKLRQWQLAERIGATQPAVTMYERGVVPEPSRLLELSRIGETTVEWILTGRHAEDDSEQMRRPGRHLIELARRFASYSEQDRRALEAAIETIHAALEAVGSSAGSSVQDIPLEEVARRLQGFERETRALLGTALEIHESISRRAWRSWGRDFARSPGVASRHSCPPLQAQAPATQPQAPRPRAARRQARETTA